MKDAWLAVLKAFLNDGKVGTALSTTLVWVVAFVGLELTPEQATMLVSPLLLILSGQFVRDNVVKKEEKKELLHD